MIAWSFISVIKEEKCSNNLELGQFCIISWQDTIFFVAKRIYPFFLAQSFLTTQKKLDFNTKSMFDAFCEKTCYLLGRV